MATATARKTSNLATPDMTVAVLKAMANAHGIPVPAKPSKAALIALINAPKPAAKPAAKPSPVRSDVTPADVKPDAAETARKIAALESVAADLLSAAMVDSVKLAVTWARIYPLKPWKASKTTVKAYFEAHGMVSDRYIMPTDARRVLQELVYRGTLSGELADKYSSLVEGATFTPVPDAPVDHMVFMTASSPRSIQRDRDVLKIANPNRQESHRTPTPADSTAGTPAASPDDTAGTPVLSMTSVRAFILDLDDTDMLEELSELIAERMTALA